MRTGVVALLVASVLVPLAPAAQAGPRYRSRAYSPDHRHGHHHGDSGWAVAGGFFVGTLFGALISQPRRVVVRESAPVYVGPPPTTTWVGSAPVPGVVQPTSPAPTITSPSVGQVWIPATTIWRETRVVEPAVYGTRRVPVVEEVQVPIFQDRSVPVTREVVDPVFEQRRDPVTGVWTTVQVGESRRTLVVGTRIERVQVGTRTERRRTGVRDEQVLLRPETTRIVRVPEHVPGHWASTGTGELAAPEDDVEAMPEPTPQAVPRPMPPAPPPPTDAPPTEPEPEPVLPGPINPR
jgi:hypothetical protein